MIFNLDDGGGPMSASKISFDGDTDFAREGGQWEAAFYSSGTLRFKTAPGLCDIWILDGGENGGSGSTSGGYVYSGKGGDGGLHKLHASVRLKRGVDYTLTVGAAGAASSLVGGDIDLSAANGTKKSGGARAQMPQGITSTGTVNTGGKDGVWPYEADSDSTLISELAGKLLGASGGAGNANNDKYVYTDEHSGDPAGGDDGGGEGGVRSRHNGTAGTGYGSGGGGGYGDGSGGSHGTGGTGGPGLILIRPKMEVSA